jgi:hypothetical protein
LPRSAAEDDLDERLERSRQKKLASNAKVTDFYTAEDEKLAGDVINGVTIHWFKGAFRLDVETIKRRLANCPVKGLKRGNIKVYDLPTAAAFLVTPKLDVEAYLKLMKSTQLPPNLQPAIWSARLKEQAWKEKAGDLWPTDAVLDVFSKLNAMLRDKIQAMPDALEEMNQSHKVIDTVRNLADGLLEEIYLMLVELPKQGRTESQLAALDAVVEEPAARKPMMGENLEGLV